MQFRAFSFTTITRLLPSGLQGAIYRVTVDSTKIFPFKRGSCLVNATVLHPPNLHLSNPIFDTQQPPFPDAYSRRCRVAHLPTMDAYQCGGTCALRKLYKWCTLIIPQRQLTNSWKHRAKLLVVTVVREQSLPSGVIPTSQVNTTAYN